MAGSATSGPAVAGWTGPRRAIVSGGCGAIGGAIAVLLAAQGHDVAVIDSADSATIVRAINAEGRRGLGFAVDLSDEASTRQTFGDAVAALGGLDVLVNAAGIVARGSIASIEGADWDRVLAINLKSVFTCCQAAMVALRTNGGGRIINIGSVVAKNGGNARPWLDPAEQAQAGNAAYAASKAGVHSLTF